MLKTYMFLLENAIDTSKFGQLRLTEKPSLRKWKTAIFHNVRNVQLRHDLYRCAGMRCVKYESGFVLEIFSNDEVAMRDMPSRS